MSPSGPGLPAGGPYFEDLTHGQVLADAPALTLTSGLAAQHQAIVGDRLRLALDAPLCKAVTGVDRQLAHPSLVCDVAIGQSTGFTQRVRANLFYRGLVLLRPVFVGDTLRTTSTVVGLKQNRIRAGVPATGLVALRMRTVDQYGRTVLDFWRCPMLPMRDRAARTGHSDSFDDIPAELDRGAVDAAVPAWELGPLRACTPGPHAGDVEPGMVFPLEAGETVSAAPELARLTLNLAAAHTDATSTEHGRRLVYGGHTISIAAAQASRALPGLATIVAWQRCDHLAPVFEDDVLRTTLHVDGVRAAGDGVLALLRAAVDVVRDGGLTPVLDWRFVGLLA